MNKLFKNGAANFSAFYGHTIRTTVNKIISQFGESIGPSSDGKTNYNWELVYDNTISFTLYDWKENEFGNDEYIDFHIGANSRKNSEAIYKILKDIL